MTGTGAAAAAGPDAGPDVASELAGPSSAGGPSRAAGQRGGSRATGDEFQVHLDNFSGPFDLLLDLIARHRLDVTEVALSVVTDDFLSHIRARQGAWSLDTASSFLVVAATLLDLKAARLLPSADVEDEEDLALLEARDLLFARLLQYRAYKSAAAWLSGRFTTEGRRYPRHVWLEPRFASLLPEVLIALGPAEFAALAERAMRPRDEPTVVVDHLHAPRVSVPEQAALLAGRLQRAGVATFRELSVDAAATLEVVGRFLALLELYRDGVVAFTQEAPLAELTVRWVGGSEAWHGRSGTAQDWNDPAAGGGDGATVDDEKQGQS